MISLITKVKTMGQEQQAQEQKTPEQKPSEAKQKKGLCGAKCPFKLGYPICFVCAIAIIVIVYLIAR